MPEPTTPLKKLFSLYERNRGLALNLLFCLYLATLNPWVTHQLRLIVLPQQANPVWAYVIWGLIAIEFLAIHLKYPEIRWHIQQAKGQRYLGGWFLIFLCLAHMVLNIVLAVVALGALGITGSGEDGTFPIVIMISTLKEFYLLFYLLMMGRDVKKWRVERAERIRGVLDLVFLAYACFGFSATWNMIFGDVLFDPGLSLAIQLSIVLFLIFCLLYLPLRLMALIEEWYVTKGTPAFIHTLINIGVAYVGLMLPMWVGVL
jgi:hypothetical protein